MTANPAATMSHASTKVLVYRLGSLGDGLLAIPTFRAIRKAYPTAEITFLTNLPVKTQAAPLVEVLEQTNLCNSVIAYPIRLRDPLALWRLWRKLNSARYHLVVHLTAPRGRWNSLRDFLFFKLALIPHVIGVPWSGKDMRCKLDPASGRYEWEAKRLARRVRKLGKVDLEDDRSWDLELTTSELEAAREILIQHGLGGEFMSASIGTKWDTNDWTNPNWLEMLKQVAERAPKNTGLVLLGSADEFARSELLKDCWSGPRINLSGKVGVRVSAALMRLSKVFIGHDSGPMHLAATVGVPCVGIFSARNPPGRWFPRGKNNTIFYNQTPCYGCELETCLKYGKKCIMAHSPRDVATSLLRYFSIGKPL